MSRSLVLGELVPGLWEAHVVARPDVDFQPSRIVVPDEVAEHFAVVDVKVGDCSQLIAYNRFPASVFSASAKDADVDFMPVVRGKAFCVVVRNVVGVERRFEAVVEGREAICEDMVFAKFGRHIGRTVVGLGHNVVPSGQWRDVQVMPQISFCLERLVVSFGYAEGFVVEDVQVRGRDNAIIASCPQSVLAESYGVGSEGRLKTMKDRYMVVGEVIRVVVSNRTPEARVFSGAIFGSYRC